MNARVWRLPMLLSCVPLLCGASCHGPMHSGALIEAYRNAACVAPTLASGITPPTRGWDAPIQIAGGSTAIVHGADMVGGRIAIAYQPSGQELIAVQPGDYIYPKDVRLNDRRDRLLVKASGLAGGRWKETWLYEYDLVQQKMVHKNRVQPEALPAECLMPGK